MENLKFGERCVSEKKAREVSFLSAVSREKTETSYCVEHGFMPVKNSLMSSLLTDRKNETGLVGLNIKRDC